MSRFLLIWCVPTTAALLLPPAQVATPLPAEAPRSIQIATTSVGETGVSILVYHRFGPTATDTMTVRTATFRWQLDYLRQHHHPVVPLRTLIAYLQGHSAAPPPGAVVITADDGHESIFTEMLPVVREYQRPSDALHLPVSDFERVVRHDLGAARSIAGHGPL